MLFCPVNEPTPALLAKRVNETRRNRLGEYLVAGIETLRGHDSQGKLPGIERPAGERFLTKVDRLAALEASMNIDVGRDFAQHAGCGFILSASNTRKKKEAPVGTSGRRS